MSLLLIGIGAAAILAGLTTKNFRPRGFGIGDRAAVIPRWFGRSWTIGVGLLFLYAGWKGLPVIVVRTLAIVIGASLIIFNSVALVEGRGQRNIANIWALLVGVILLLGGVVFKIKA